jgi:hypothetical protein
MNVGARVILFQGKIGAEARSEKAGWASERKAMRGSRWTMRATNTRAVEQGGNRRQWQCSPGLASSATGLLHISIQEIMPLSAAYLGDALRHFV